MPTYFLYLSRILLVAALLGVAPLVQADIERSQALIRTMPVQGITLSMTPRQAFETLMNSGFRAGDIKSFDEWRSGTIEFVRGSRSDPGGESWVSLGRKPGVLINIGETTNKLQGERIDYAAEIRAAQNHFGVTAEETGCSFSDEKKAGACNVSDGNNQKPFAFLLLARATNRTVQLGYAFEPTVGLDDEPKVN